MLCIFKEARSKSRVKRERDRERGNYFRITSIVVPLMCVFTGNAPSTVYDYVM